MSLPYAGAITIKNKVQQIPFSKRKEPRLNERNEYFISWGRNIFYPCILDKVINEFGYNEVEIRLKLKSLLNGKKFLNSKGNVVEYQTQLIEANRIGSTPIMAIQNQA